MDFFCGVGGFRISILPVSITNTTAKEEKSEILMISDGRITMVKCIVFHLNSELKCVLNIIVVLFCILVFLYCDVDMKL